MAETRRYCPTQQLDLEQILIEAQHRWLRPSEVCEILRNYKKFCLAPDPPNKPIGGSLFLFDRKALRYFRKDGHSWRKKKDGKTVREAHEKLKAGSVDVLHCYYAHGEDNENFQRRCYWMLDGQLEHIVFVHYREVKEGSRSSVPRLLHADPRPQTGTPETTSAPCSAQANSAVLTVVASNEFSPSTADWSRQTPSSEYEDVDSGDDLGTSSLPESNPCIRIQGTSLHAQNAAGLPKLSRDLNTVLPGFAPVASSSIWPEFNKSDGNMTNLNEHKISLDQPSGSDYSSSKMMAAKFDAISMTNDGLAGGCRVSPDGYIHPIMIGSQRMAKVPKEHDVHPVHHHSQIHSGSQMIGVASNQYLGFDKNSPVDGLRNGESGELKKLDSFGRWMDKEMGGDCDDSLMASDSGNYWKPLDTQNDDKEVSSLSRHMQLDTDSLGPSLSQEQLFSILEYSPDWAYSWVETKVLISGTFLGDVKHPRSTKWCCMFGEVEVPAEVLTESVLRCHAPAHAPGRVPFYITCSNRLACSEVREFEYREKPSGVTHSVPVKTEPEVEMRFLLRFAKMLNVGLENKWLDCSLDKCDKCILKGHLLSSKNDEYDWAQIEKASVAFDGKCENAMDILIQKLLKDKLYEWLVCKVHEGGRGPSILDEEGQGVIHLAAALGYEWAMAPIIGAGVSPSFRDAHGRTGIHWAAYFGREETVVALVRLGAFPGAVEDPTPKFPGGRTAADLASTRGHKGIAGYLGEADLTTHLSSLTIKGSVTDSVAATIVPEEAIENIQDQIVVSPDGRRGAQLSLEGSLAAVRKSAQAAALIQAAFRDSSFRHGHLTAISNESLEESTDLLALSSLHKTQKMGHFSDYLHSAAVKIQQKYRGWKGRKEYLRTRNRIVKIQAHVRGHQVRKQYKKVVWSVSIVEKAVLRWRRKGAGLRGFRAHKAIGNTESEIGKVDEYEFLLLGRKQKVAGVEKALARVQSMVRSTEGRDQYMRMVAKSQKSQMGGAGTSSTSLQVQPLEQNTTVEDPHTSVAD